MAERKPKLGKGKAREIILYLEKRSRKDWIKKQRKTVKELYPVFPKGPCLKC